MKYKCPICQKTIKMSPHKQSEEMKFFPFCSRQCKMVDLGAWLDGEYKIISEAQSQQAGETGDGSSEVPGQKQ
jgi:endogenous inhibitor of DNA gyrase (YacG/DUF329 family)